MTLVSREEIRLMPLRYSIGKRPLSILLGWGELTYTRLIDGNKPSDEHAAELRNLIDDPAAFAHVLQAGRSRVTEMAYTRSFKAVDALLAEEGGIERATRIYAVADKFCQLAEGDITPSALQRLAYYAQGRSLAALDEPLFDDAPRAAASGPRYDRIHRFYSFAEIQRACAAGGVAVADARRDDLQAEPDARAASEAGVKEGKLFSKRERQIIEATFADYGGLSGQALAAKAREETPWRKARKRAAVDPEHDCDAFITPKSMKKFFAKKKA